MCLYTQQAEPKIAKKDIICYKLLVWNKYEIEEPFKTPFAEKIIPMIPCIMEEEYSPSAFEEGACTDYCLRIKRGMIHAFQKLDEKAFKSMVWDAFFIGAFFVKCIIPKGTKYFKGVNGDICASKLILKEIVPDSVVREKLKLNTNHLKYQYHRVRSLTIDFEPYENLKEHNLELIEQSGLQEGDMLHVIC